MGNRQRCGGGKRPLKEGGGGRVIAGSHGNQLADGDEYIYTALAYAGLPRRLRAARPTHRALNSAPSPGLPSQSEQDLRPPFHPPGPRNQKETGSGAIKRNNCRGTRACVERLNKASL